HVDPRNAGCRDLGAAWWLWRQVSNQFFVITYSHWVAYDDDGYELREASLINPGFFMDFVRNEMRQPLCMVHNARELCQWMISWRGQALIDSALMKEKFPRMLGPSRSWSQPRLKNE
ncbi:hypothetical protein, partial [Chromobacterium alticapitis]|uniref:hypothetical protein n=1 Tax=Chromobacterium alticapitis TaxID=2073169 RepID=UPI001E512498